MPDIVLKYLACLVVAFCWIDSGYAQVSETSKTGSQQQIIAVFPERFPPIHDVTVNDMPTGFAIEVLEAVASRAGLKVKYLPVATWQEAITRLKRGEADIIPNLGVTAERKKYALFTRVINKIPVSLMVLKDTGAFSKLSDLRNTRYIVGVIETNVGLTILKSEPTIRKRVYPHLADVFADLAAHKIDAMIYPVPVAKYLAHSLRLKSNLKVLGEPLVEIPRAIAVGKSNPQLLKKLDTALASLLASDSYRKIYQRWHPEPVFWTQVRIAYLVGIFLILLSVIYVYFRFNVLREVNNKLQRTNVFIKTVLDISAEGVLTLDKNGVIHSANKAAEKLFERNEHQLINSSIRELMPENEAREFIKSLVPARLKHSGAGIHFDDQFKEYRVRKKNGQLFPVRMALDSALLSTQWFFICTIQDVSQLREAQKLAEFYSSHDPLTGLVNQNGFSLLLKNLLAQSVRHKRKLSCLHVEINRMTAINNSYGHATGDKVLLQFSKQLDNIIRESDFLGAFDDNILVRVSGTRFIIILPETDLEGAAGAAKRIIHEIERNPFHINGQNINVACNIGIANYPEHGKTETELLTRSEAALRVAKISSHNPFHIYVEAEDDVEKNTDAWAEKIISGLREDRFFLLFQPILDIKSGTVHHFEALVRYLDKDNQVISPNEFIPVAERYGLIKRLDHRIVELAISHLAGLEAAGHDISIAINLSGSNIGDPELFDWLEKLLEENELNPNHIVFEITETASLFSITVARSFIDSIKALGCRIALDDFGTGLSSFSYLRNFPVDILKIDGSFISNLPNSHEDRVMVRSMVDVAHSLGKQVVAEFVSSEEILGIVRDFGVDYAQGYHVSEPVKLETFMAKYNDSNEPG